MRSNVNKLYVQLVEVEIGDKISTMLDNGISYTDTLKNILRQQGYVEDVDFKTVYDKSYLKTFFIKLKEILPLKELFHNINISDIFYNSWGWEQTNIDFYQVVAVTKKTVKIRQVNQHRDYNAANMSGKTIALMNDFKSDDVLVKKPYLWDGAWRLNFEHGTGCLWDGSQLTYTTYA